MIQHQHPRPYEVSTPQQDDLEYLLTGTTVAMLGAMHWHVGADWHMGPRTLPDTFFFVVVAGRMTGMARQITRPLRPGQFMMVPEGTVHEAWLPTGRAELEVVAIHCHLFDRYQRPVLPLFPRPFGEVDDPASWQQRLQLLVTLINTSPASGQAYGEVLIKELLVQQIRHGARLLQAPEQPDPRIEQALQTIRQHYHTPLTVEDLAAEVELSTVQFRKLFRRYAGESPKAYLAHYRLQMAAHLLKTTDATVKAIAAQAGYGSDHYFHLTFKARYDCTPTEYRERGPAL